MPLFKVPERAGRSQDKSIIKKSKSNIKQSTTIKGGSGLLGRITEIKAMVEKNLGQYKDDYIVIQDENTLHDYIESALTEGEIAIDTETTGLDPLQDDIVGVCLYTPGQKAAYIPINHISYVTGVKVENQLSKEVIAEELKRLQDRKGRPYCDVIMFNAKFDIRFLRNQLGVYLNCDWDAYLAARLMNENEPTSGLKALHKKYVLDGKEDEFAFDVIFKGVPFDKIPISTAYLYAAHDAIITHELYEFQKKYLHYEPSETLDSRNGMNGVSWVFENIEMPCIQVVCDMEDTGVLFDMNYNAELSEKYNILMQEKEEQFYKLCSMYDTEIESYKTKNPDHKLDTPINIASPTQLAILLYDILKVESPDPKKPRGTGVEILSKIDDTDGIEKICKAILEYREFAKLISTYIDKLPECVNPKDNRIHCSFNQYGADTGRFSSSDPNLQNIPSHNKDIRKMFVATHDEDIVTTESSQLELDKWCEVECHSGWKCANKLVIGDVLKDIDGNFVTISKVIIKDKVIIDFT